jgi:hypothetical protein
MHATSPSISQPTVSGIKAFGAVIALAAAVTAGAVIAVNLAPTSASPAAGGASAAAALKLQRAGEIGALTPAQRGLLEQRAGEIGAGAASGAVLAPIVRLGGRDPMAYWNNYSLLGATIVAPIYSGKTVDPVVRAQAATNLHDHFMSRSDWNAATKGNDTDRGTSHR